MRCLRRSGVCKVASIVERVQKHFAQDFSLSALKVIIILWALFIIFLALVLDDVWLLAGILAYEILP